jgi:hypothetical protein
MTRVNTVPSAPVAVTVPPFSSRSADPARPGSLTGATEHPPGNADVSPTEANAPEELSYLLKEPVTESFNVMEYLTLESAP